MDTAPAAVTALAAVAAPAAVLAPTAVAAPAVAAPAVAAPVFAAPVVAAPAVAAPAVAAPLLSRSLQCGPCCRGPALHLPLPRRPAEPRCPREPHCPACAATAATAAAATTAAISSPTILTFDAEGGAVEFDVWVDDLQLFLQCDSRDGVSLFNHTSGVSTAPAASTDIVHYSSPATAALNRLMLPPLPQFPTSLLTSALVSPATALPFPLNSVPRTPPPPMYITLYYLFTRLPDSLASVRDHFLSLCPTELTVDLLEERLAAAEKSILAVGASLSDCRTPFFEGCSPVPLLPSVASAAAVDLVGTEEPLTPFPPSYSANSRRHRPLLIT
ncbi:unnamed protein product, partial [Closterium sp. NIES-54]